ncbi:hypothetical protein Scep_021814 [Stephania cephalantha]|uniref:Ubiquitin carboxyl-terminal hydrolase 26 n=1 Tax=Stephania cephalantha TaxID=152367 RepID=A0AAP0I1R7_9MAGN
MTRPTTRNKNKRHKPEDDHENLAEILRKIYLTGEVAREDINKLYMISKPLCQGCRVNSKDNPNCFCGLVPPSNGTRKSGLWQKLSDILLALGPDPCMDVRESIDSPAGLTNLGATCYANSVLQFLYMNESFRTGIFSVEPELLKHQPVLDQLARLFAQLHSSKRAFIDSAPFIRTLELDNGVQQDGHEFLTLLLSLLERSLGHSKVSKARTVVQDLFRGSVSNVTRCSKCGQESEASSKVEDFYELELNIKGLNNLDESLKDYLSVEELCGDNQYFCESCRTRVNATRFIKLRTLPKVLNFQLKRCVFLPKTTTKKKLTSVFSFHGELDMGQRLNESSQMELVYELSAVLIHKGSAVNSGHYVANIKDERTGQWWEFDDEHVSKLGSHPFGGSCSSSTVKPTELESIAQLSSSKTNNSHSNGGHIDTTQLSSDSCFSCHPNIFSSADAYMLMYTRRNTKDSVESIIDGDINGKQLTIENDVSLPFDLHEEVKNINTSYMNFCGEYKFKKERELEIITNRRQEVRSILSEAPVPSLDDPYFWVSTDWLRTWADNISSPVLNNSSIQCSHGRVPFSSVGSMKRLSAKAWNSLLAKYHGGPTLADADYCIDCLMESARSMVRADDYRGQRTTMKEVAEAAISGKFHDGNLFYISRAWLIQWLRRKNIDFPCEAYIGPTTSITCPHGGLMPEQASGAKRVLVPENLWLFLCGNANEGKPDHPLDYSVFPLDSENCAICSVELTEAAFLEDSLRATKIKQRQNHEKLFLGKSMALSPSCKYYLLPSSWLSKWRSFITSSGKNTSLVEPESLESVIKSLICEKHSRLQERPLDLFYKGGGIFQKASQMDGLTIIMENDWKLFCKEWKGNEWRGISCEIELANEPKSGSIGGSEEQPITEACINSSNDLAIDELESIKLIVKTIPVICEDCIGERESCELMKKLSYCNEDICVFFVRGKEAPRSIIEASGACVGSDRRTSKRYRKSSNGNSVNLKVSGSTSIYQLKMMIWESFGVVKENQLLHKGPNIIEGESATLADMNIFPGDLLWVRDSEIHENRDIADELSEEKMDLQHSEEGFRGTLLTSNMSTQVI